MVSHKELDERLAKEFEAHKKYEFMSWFPNVSSVHNEGAYITIRFRLASDTPLSDTALKTIQHALNASKVETEGLDGWGCESCGYGSTQNVDVYGWDGT